VAALEIAGTLATVPRFDGGAIFQVVPLSLETSYQAAIFEWQHLYFRQP